MALADLTDATPDTSSEDIQQYADQVVQEVLADRQGDKPEGKSDAQIANDLAGPPLNNTPAEKNSGSNTAREGEETGDVAEAPEWMTDDVKAEAAAYGIDEADLSEFASREELNRAFRILDKTALAAGQKAIAESEGTTRNEKGQFAKKEEAADKPKEATPKDGRYEIPKEFTELYDETIVQTLTGMRDYYESRFAVLEEHFTQANRLVEAQQFDSEIDKLDMPKIFGKTGEEAAEELQRREAVMAQAKVLQAGHTLFGRQMPMPILVKQAAQAMFPTEFEKQLLKNHTRKISKQSNLRQGGSPTKPLPPSDDPREEFDRKFRELEGR